jgi:hypothetical protein
MRRITEYLRDYLGVVAVSLADDHHSPAIRLVTSYNNGFCSDVSKLDSCR